MSQNDLMFAGVTVPEAVVRLADAQREVNVDGQKKGSLNKAVVNYVEQLLADFVSHNRLPSVEVGESPVTLDRACSVMLAKLDADHQRLLRTFAKERRLPIEAFLMSAIIRAKERGEAGVVMYEWAANAPQVAPVPQMLFDGTCEFCHQSFKPSYEGQRFCPPPPDESDSCGRKYNIEKIKADLATKRRPPSQFAPPAGMRLRSSTDRTNSYVDQK